MSAWRTEPHVSTVMAVDHPPPYRRILVAVDGSDTATAGLIEATRLARQSGAALHVVHVVDALAHASGFETGSAYAEEVVPHMRAGGQAVLEAAQACAAAQGVATSTRLLEVVGSGPAELIVQEAETADADLIALGTHGRRGLDRVLVGSVAEQVLRLSRVPVLLVRGAGGA
jgi:nucleotide-binding universal stress UspA family protein